MEKNKLQKIADGLGNMRRTASVTLNTGSVIDEENTSLNAIANGLKKASAEKKAKRLQAEAEYQKQQDALEKEKEDLQQEKADAFE